MFLCATIKDAERFPQFARISTPKALNREIPAHYVETQKYLWAREPCVCVCVDKSVLLNSLTAASCICDSIAQQHSAFVLASHIVMRQVTMKIYPCCRKPHPPKCMQLLVAALRDCDRALRARARDEIIAALISPFGQWHKKGGEGAINFQFYWLHDDYY